MPTLIVITLVAATVGNGLLAGVYLAFVTSVMPGLGEADDPVFVTTMRRFNARIQNGWFLAVFLGAPLLTLASLVFALLDAKPVAPTGLAVIGSLVALGITLGVNVPLNNALDAEADATTARRGFERRWNRWNLVRMWASVAASGCLCWASLVRGPW